MLLALAPSAISTVTASPITLSPEPASSPYSCMPFQPPTATSTANTSTITSPTGKRRRGRSSPSSSASYSSASSSGRDWGAGASGCICGLAW